MLTFAEIASTDILFLDLAFDNTIADNAELERNAPLQLRSPRWPNDLVLVVREACNPLQTVFLVAHNQFALHVELAERLLRAIRSCE